MADILSRWRDGLAKTSKATFGRIAGLLGATEITPDTWDELEALLIQADLGIETATEIIESLQRVVRTEGLLRSDELEQALREELRKRLDEPPAVEWTERMDRDPIRIAGCGCQWFRKNHYHCQAGKSLYK